MDGQVDERLQALIRDSVCRALDSIPSLVSQRIKAEVGIYKSAFEDAAKSVVKRYMASVSGAARRQVKAFFDVERIRRDTEIKKLEGCAKLINAEIRSIDELRVQFNTFVQETNRVVVAAIEAGVTRAVDQFTSPKK